MNLITGNQVTERFRKICIQEKWDLVICPETSFTGLVRFNNKNATTFRNLVIDINPHSAGIITMFKSETNFFLEASGFAIPSFTALKRDSFKPPIFPKLHSNYKYPLIVKPNTGTEGNKVFKAESEDEVLFALNDIFSKYSVAVVQNFATGEDNRVVVFNNSVVAAYKRVPLHIIGNGIQTIGELVDDKLTSLGEAQKVGVDINTIWKILKAGDFADNVVLPSGKKVYLSHIANLSSGGLGIDLTTTIHDDFKKIAVEATKASGLNFCGVDIIANDITKPSQGYAIIEMNSAPGLENFANLNVQCNERVNLIYTEIFKQIKKRNEIESSF
jgi:D-alanine-D-alanine ligase-like ATP-grasp enzyme